MATLEQEIILTLNNTEELYEMALAVTDFELDNNQLSNLTGAVLRQIAINGIQRQATATDELKEVVREEVRLLQQEAKA